MTYLKNEDNEITKTKLTPYYYDPQEMVAAQYVRFCKSYKEIYQMDN